jgi:hypothetical protein
MKPTIRKKGSVLPQEEHPKVPFIKSRSLGTDDHQAGNWDVQSCRTGTVNLKQFHIDWYLTALAVTEPSS